MKPIAVVYWLDRNGKQNEKKCFSQDSLDRFTQIVTEGDYVNWTCMCSGDAAIPLRPPRRHVRAI